MTSLLPAADRAAIKTAMRLLVADVGGLDAAASVTRLQRSALAETYAPNLPDRMPPADVVADLESVGGQPRVTQVMARIAGHLLVPVPADAGLESLALVEVFRGSSGVGEAYAAALRDGRLDRAERQAVADRLIALNAACVQAVAALLHDKEGSASHG